MRQVVVTAWYWWRMYDKRHTLNPYHAQPSWAQHAQPLVCAHPAVHGQKNRTSLLWHERLGSDKRDSVYATLKICTTLMRAGYMGRVFNYLTVTCGRPGEWESLIQWRMTQHMTIPRVAGGSCVGCWSSSHWVACAKGPFSCEWQVACTVRGSVMLWCQCHAG
jgi:hypothetical protein